MPEGERTEPPSPRRLQKAIEEGNVPRSQELSGAVTLLVVALVVRGSYPSMVASWERLFAGTLYSVSENTFLQAAAATLVRIVPFLLIPLAVAFTVVALFTGFRVYPKKMVPRVDALNPGQNLKRIFSSEGLERLGIGLLKMILLGAVAYALIKDRILGIAVSQPDPATFLNVALKSAADIMVYLAGVYVLIGLADFWYQRIRWWNSLKMTRQEVKEELKSMEGDPTVKGRIRTQMRRYAMRRAIANVKKATVVVTNPTEYAVALRYEKGMPAPEVVAKGAGWLAQRIKEQAKRYNIPIVAKPELARTIFRKVEVGDYITPDLYRAVAAVLVEVMRRKRR
ncbi:EscU/YscU/HrcU family type III secretion system export apparatus switch protein [Coprothermobacteraceae bacterium]|nr:EscU/YscU/HrcU family type III secretion system export apparatus switch protein [Coprothermobacteraceae bacterium]